MQALQKECVVMPHNPNYTPPRCTDDTVMTWGHHKGDKLRDIPDDYWIWFLKQSWCDNYPHHVRYANTIIDDN